MIIVFCYMMVSWTRKPAVRRVLIMAECNLRWGQQLSAQREFRDGDGKRKQDHNLDVVVAFEHLAFHMAVESSAGLH
jgi:hypothetical protein